MYTSNQELHSNKINFAWQCVRGFIKIENIKHLNYKFVRFNFPFTLWNLKCSLLQTLTFKHKVLHCLSSCASLNQLKFNESQNLHHNIVCMIDYIYGKKNENSLPLLCPRIICNKIRPYFKLVARFACLIRKTTVQGFLRLHFNTCILSSLLLLFVDMDLHTVFCITNITVSAYPNNRDFYLRRKNAFNLDYPYLWLEVQLLGMCS